MEAEPPPHSRRYDVKCVVRPREIPADFLRDWGATVVNADLKDPASIPAALVGVHTVIDCATARPEEPISTIDWEGKVALVQTCQAMGIQRFIFFSIFDCDKHPEVPLMNVKACTEDFIRRGGVPGLGVWPRDRLASALTLGAFAGARA